MKRAFFHFFGGLIFPFIYYFTSKPNALKIFIILYILVLVFEWERRHHSTFNEWLMFYFGGLFKEKEKQSITAMPYFLSGVIVTVFLYTKPIAIVSLCFLTFGDVTAAIVGRRFGKNKVFNNHKSVEGSLAFFLVVSLVGLALKNLPYLSTLTNQLLLIGALTATLVEILPLPVDDNLTVPISTGFVLQLLH